MKKCISNPLLYKYLCELDTKQFKVFYGILVHCRAHGNNFISTKNFFKLWCELNSLCYETDRSFPCPYADRKALKAYCHNHPYYFIDILPLETVAKLFAKYCDEHLDMLARFIRILSRQGSRAAHRYIMVTFCLDHTLYELVSDFEEHIEAYS